MNELQIYQVTTDKGRIVELEYDQEGDMLEIFFERGPASGALELADPLILRFNRETGQALSLSVLTFSQVIQPTELGPRSFQLDGLERLPIKLRKKVVNMITTPPVSHFLKIFAYYPQAEQPPIHISYIERAAALPLAA
jgi:YD repeat-containing protein